MKVLFDGRAGEPTTLSEVIGQAVGAASVCWKKKKGKGEFDEKRARVIVEEVIDWIETNSCDECNFVFGDVDHDEDDLVGAR